MPTLMDAHALVTPKWLYFYINPDEISENVSLYITSKLLSIHVQAPTHLSLIIIEECGHGFLNVTCSAIGPYDVQSFV